MQTIRFTSKLGFREIFIIKYYYVFHCAIFTVYNINYTFRYYISSSVLLQLFSYLQFHYTTLYELFSLYIYYYLDVTNYIRDKNDNVII